QKTNFSRRNKDNMKKDALVFVRHILESIEKIEKYSANISKDEFLKDDELQDAIVRRLEIIGEAAKNISSDFKNKYPKILWKEISGMRDKLTHQYFGIDLEIVWNVLEKDLPNLKKIIQEILFVN
ncbi:MAG: DUF86 domain-containing protein, partial [archaeon]|nr:DUF86 domain-containing protein [archaeon]